MERQIRQLVVIADDLTGALDAAAPFCAAGSEVVVATRPGALAAALACGANVTAVSTRSRELGAGEARRLMAQVVAQVPRGRSILKKVDSRLKGPIAAELEALPAGPLLVLPAIPEFGRIVRDGKLQGFGVTEPFSIRDRLGARGAGADIPDTVSQAEMVAALRGAPADAVLVGARGLTQALAQMAGLRAEPPEPLQGRIAIAVGSTDPITLAQVAALEAAGVAPVLAPSGIAEDAGPPAGVTLMQATEGPERASLRIAANLGRSFAVLAGRAQSLILTGGATAEAVLDALDVDILTVEGDILPGLPLSRAKGWRIVTKSGGFGGPGTLCELTRAMWSETE